MKRILPFIMLMMTAPLAARADITTRFASSVQLSVGGAHTSAERIGSSFAISGSNIDTAVGDDANVVSSGTIASGVYSPGTVVATQDTPGSAFSFTQSYTEADDVLTSAPTVGQVSLFSDQTSYAAGTAGDLAGSITSSGTVSITAGGAGTSAIGQFVSEITVID